MLEFVSQAIDRFYRKSDHNSFKACCEKQLQLFDELRSYIELHELRLIEGGDKNFVSRDWYIHFEDYKQGEFEISYTTIIKVSKVAPLFYVLHKFAIENKDEDKMTPILRNADNQPYTKKQYALHDKISAVLAQKGYTELSYADMEETVEGFKMPEGVTIFGHNVTVELLLFEDLYDICGDE
jgi:hypothetical protein